MRVCFISSIPFWGGGEKWVLTTAGGLQQREHQISIKARPASELAKRAGAAGIPVHTVPLLGDFDLSSLLSLISLFRRERPEIVCLNMDKELRLAGWALKLGRVSSAIVRRRGSDLPLADTFRHRWSNRAFVDAMIVNSEAVRNTIENQNPWFPREQIQVVYNGIETEAYEHGDRNRIRSEFGVAEDFTLFLAAGRLTHQKAMEVFVDAAEILSAKHKSARFIIAGSGPQESFLKERASLKNLQGILHFAGQRDDIPDLFSACDIFAVSSRHEGLPNIVLEAFAARRPIVATRVSSLPELIEDGVTGLLVPPEDPHRLAQSLERLMLDSATAARLAEAGHLLVQERFSLKRALDETERLFLNLSERKKETGATQSRAHR